MKIELRNVRYNERLSDETSCFDAVLVIDGNARGGVRNRGCGGAHEYDDRRAEQELDTYGKTLPPKEVYGMKLAMDADLLVSDALSDWLRAKELKNIQKKMATSIVFVSKSHELYALKFRDPAAKAAALANPSSVAALRGADVILNLLRPSEQAKYVLRS